MNPVIIATEDGTYIASCRATGINASGRTHEHAVRNFHLSAASLQRADESLADDCPSVGEAPRHERGGDD